MPRIPIRVEPYSSPAKQHRHYKCKRDQVLRALGKAAYINGSQFAILLVSARGDVETYASDAFQERLDDWFMKSGVADEARQRALDNVPDHRAAPPTQLTADDLLDDVPESPSGGATPSLPGMPDDPFLEPWSNLAGGADKVPQTDEWSRILKRSEISDETQSIGEGSASAAGSPHLPLMPQMSTPVQSMRPRTGSVGRVAANAHQPQHMVVLRNEAERTAFMEMRFGQLQQVMCKMIAKEWIKVIEPKKQTRFPYNKGEEGKPSWWPADVRHKEPDHLMKPERHALLLAMLRSNQARIARLQLATAEVVVQIKTGRVSLLMDIYRIAREEEQLRDQGMDLDTPITVGVSSLEGWDNNAGRVSEQKGEGSTQGTPRDEAAPGSEPIAKLLASQRKRRRYTATAEQTPDRSGASMAWTPLSEHYDQHQGLRAVPQVSPSHPMTGAVHMRPMPPVDVQRAHALPFDASDLSNYSPMHPPPSSGRSDVPPMTPAHGAAMGGAGHAPLTQSPELSRSGFLSYSPSEHELHRSASTAVPAPVSHGVTQPMKPTRSAPAHMPNTPEAWQVLQSQQGPGFRMDQPQPTPMALQAHGDGDHRVSWPFSYSVYPHGPQHPGAWAMPETPMHRQHMQSMSMSVGSSSDVRFSPSFDTSFTSNSGPMTPGNMMPMQQVHAHMPAPGGNAMGFHAPHKSPAVLTGELPPVGVAPSHDMPPFDAKLEPKPNVRYSNMNDWPCQ